MVYLKFFYFVVSLTFACHFSLGQDIVEPVIDEADIPVIEGQGGDVVLPEDEGVLVLTKDNFDYVVASRDLVLVEFYAPWCGHCKSLAPEYAKAAQELKAEGITLAKVDATEESDLAGRFEITGYPTIKLFSKGKPTEDFDGKRTTVGIIEYMRKKADPNYQPPPSDVIELTDEDFHATTTAAPLMLVEFYAPWCGHCKKLAPEYEKAATELKAYNIPLAKIDATEQKKVAEEFGITGYPILRVMRNGRAFDYKGGRDSRGIVSYMKEQQRLPSQDLRTLLNAKNGIVKTQPTAFGFFTSDEDGLYIEYIAAANRLRGQLTFVHTFVGEVADAYKVPKDSIAVIMPEIYKSPFEDVIRVMENTEMPEADSITTWLKGASVPLLGERTRVNEIFLYSQRPLLVVYGEVDFSHQHIAATQHIRNKLLPLADKYKGKITFALSNEESYEEEIKSVGLEDSGETVNAALFTEFSKYPMEPDDEYVEEIEEFLQKFEAGKLRPFLKSQKVPKKQSGPVKVLVARNFEEEVVKGKRDYLIEFYAPWCGHCKKLEPVYKQLAKDMARQGNDIVIAKFDATANDLQEPFKVSGFPTIYFAKGGAEEPPVVFEGERTLEGLKEFIAEQQSGGYASKEEL